MERDYSNQDHNEDTNFFIGTEVENTVTKDMKTLFVVGLQDVETIIAKAKVLRCEAIYFGANHSFAPESNEDWRKWEAMIMDVLHDPAQFMCTLDFDVANMEGVLETPLVEHIRFVPMVSVKMPYVNQLGYNAVLKIDDKDFAATNEGVWCHHLHDLRTKEVFTHWNDYKDDETI